MKLQSATLASLLVVLAGPAHAVDRVNPTAPLPAGHPRLGAPAGSASALPAGHPPLAAPASLGSALPEGHPPVGGAGTPPSLPSGHPPATGARGPGAAQPEPPENRVSVAPDLPRGTIEVVVHDGKEAPATGVVVLLGTMHQDPATGESKSERQLTTDPAGVVRFEGMPTGSSYSHRARVVSGKATFASEPFRLEEGAGVRVLLHVYPVTSDIRKVLVGMRGAFFVGPREDVFQVEANFQVFNVGAVAWVPDHVSIELPEGAKAFRASESMSDARVEKTPSGSIELVGTFAPGRSEVGFQFHLDNTHATTRSLRVGLPPHVADLRVIAEGPRGMSLTVAGFPEAEPTTGQDGSRLLVTAQRMAQGAPALQAVEITLAGIPVPSAGRWYAVILAAAVVMLGFSNALRRRPSQGPGTERAEDAEEAENLVLDELVALERLRREERIGPRTYQSTHADLVDALARLAARHRNSG